MKKLETCECIAPHAESVESVRGLMYDVDTLYDAAELLKIFGDSTRINLLSALSVTELCVCDLAELLKMTVSAVSHQLRILRQSKLVKTRRSGKEVFYSLADDHVKSILALAVEHVSEK